MLNSWNGSGWKDPVGSLVPLLAPAGPSQGTGHRIVSMWLWHGPGRRLQPPLGTIHTPGTFVLFLKTCSFLLGFGWKAQTA